MSTPTTFMGLPNPTVASDANTWGGFLNTCINGFDTLAVAAVPTTVTSSGPLAVYNGVGLIEANATGGAISLTLPDASQAANKGRRYSIVKVDSSGNTVTVGGFGGVQTISGQLSVVLSTQWSVINIVSDGANWINGSLDSGDVQIAGDLGGTPASPTVISTHLSSPLPVLQGGTGVASSTGSVAVVLSNSPTLVTPVLGAATATSINGLTITSSTGTLTIANGKTHTVNNSITLAGVDGKTLTVNNSLTFAGTDATTMTFPSTSASIARTDAAQTFTGLQTFSGAISVGTTVSSYNGISTVSNGLPAILAKVDAVTQAAAISGAALYTVPASGAGQYEISWAAVVTQAATTSSTLGGTLGFQVTYTDNDTTASATTPGAGAPTAASNLAYSQTNQNNTVGTQASGVVVVNAKASSSITYSFGYTSSGGTVMQYAIHIKVKFLGL